jgi:flagellin
VGGTSDFVKWTKAGTTTVLDGSYTLSINGQQVISQALNATVGNISVDTAVANINTYQSTTGVIASKTAAGSLTLTATDGRDIRVTEAIATGTGTGTAQSIVSVFSNAITNNAVGTTATQTLDYVQRGQVTIASSASVSIGGSGTSAILGQATTLLAATGSVNTVDISSIANANLAIQSIDSALASISSNRAALGAIQNRFSSTVTNLNSISENISAARSRIQDADFAAETASMTRGQILQQAGTAVLAQANALPNTVLSLLK